MSLCVVEFLKFLLGLLGCESGFVRHSCFDVDTVFVRVVDSGQLSEFDPHFSFCCTHFEAHAGQGVD